MWARGSFSAWMPQSVPTFELKEPAHERGGSAVDFYRLSNEPAFLNSVNDNKSVFLKFDLCSLPVTAVCDTGVRCPVLANGFWTNSCKLPEPASTSPLPTFGSKSSWNTCFGNNNFCRYHSLATDTSNSSLCWSPQKLSAFLFRLPWGQSLWCFLL